MRLLGTLTTVPLLFSVYVVGEHGYICSDAEKITSTFYDQTLVEKSVTSACVPESELSAAKLAANVNAKKYPQVWVDSKDYGFQETVLLWKYQGNSPESLEPVTNHHVEETNVFVFTNKSCDILGLLQKSGDQYTICKGVKKENDKKTSSEILSKKPRPGIFTGRRGYYENYEDDSPQNDNPLTRFVDDLFSYPPPEQYRPRGYGGPPMNGPPMGGPPMSGPPMSGPPMGCPPGGCPPGNNPYMNFPPGGCGPGGCPPGNNPYMNFPPGGCPPGGCPPGNNPYMNFPPGGCPPGGCPPGNNPYMNFPPGGCGPGGCPPR
ncbi:putative candidate secreted effector protein [Blumeria hordei DH14]|uniref:Putative candidate secreted effector protein n=1 Tax=Blumeria graminis f. sp. hordei (strain DH14) TaxID=546991 RepID=N1JPH9_BLUG1|nr:putative candidate secreted effector protein [Blumeria hordei DH14]